MLYVINFVVKNTKITNNQDILAILNYMWCLEKIINSFSLLD